MEYKLEDEVEHIPTGRILTVINYSISYSHLMTISKWGKHWVLASEVRLLNYLPGFSDKI